MKVIFSYSKKDSERLVEHAKRLLPLDPDKFELIDLPSESVTADDESLKSVLLPGDCVVVFMSEANIGDHPEQVAFLEKLAVNPNCRLITVMTEDPMTRTVPDFLLQIQYIDLGNWKSDIADYEAFKAKLAAAMGSVAAILNEEDTLAHDIENVKQRLGMTANDTNMADFAEARSVPNFIERPWLNAKLDEWLEKQTARKVFCLQSVRGWGRTCALADFIKTHRSSVLGVWCQTEEEGVAYADEVLVSMALQMAIRLPAYRRFLLGQPVDFTSLTGHDLFRALFAEAGAFAIDGNQQSFVFVIDGLDRIEPELTKILVQGADSLPRWLYLLMSTKAGVPEIAPHVAATLPLTLEEKDEANVSDVKAYLKASLPEFKDDEKKIAGLAVIARSNFRIASLLVGAVRDGMVKTDLTPKKAKDELAKWTEYLDSILPRYECDLSVTADAAERKAKAQQKRVAVGGGRKPDDGKMRVFFSYGHDRNARFTEMLKKEVESLDPNIEIWFDKENIRHGDDWRTAITEGITNSQALVACLSRHSVRNPGVCLDELRIAVSERSCQIASVLLEPSEVVIPPLTISHIEALDFSNWEEKFNQGARVFKPWLKKAAKDLYAVLMRDKTLTGDISTLRDILHQSTAGGYYERIRTLLKNGFIGREWIFRELEAWLRLNPERKVFCIAGEAGFGKSAIIAQLASQNQIQVVGVHFCSSGSSRDTVAGVMESLAFQMATRLPEYRKYLISRREVIEETTDNEVLFNILFSSAISDVAVAADIKSYLIVVDALDEAPGELADFIADHQYRFPTWLNVLVTSRPNEPHVREALQRMNPMSLKSADGRNQTDAELWCKHWLSQLEDINATEAQQLTRSLLESSGGNFRYLTFFRQMVDYGYLNLKDLLTGSGRFPAGLATLYDTYMSRICKDADEYQREYSGFLGVLAAVNSSFTLDEAAEILGQTKESVEEIVIKLAGLLQVADGTVSFQHKSVRDWLVSESNTNWPVDMRQSTKKVVLAWLPCIDSSQIIETAEDEADVFPPDFDKDKATKLGILILNYICPGDGFTSTRLASFRKYRVSEIGLTLSRWDKCNDLVYLMVLKDGDFTNICRYSWCFISYLMLNHFDYSQEIRDATASAILEVITDIDSDWYKELAIELANSYLKRKNELDLWQVSLVIPRILFNCSEEEEKKYRKLFERAIRTIEKVYGEESEEAAMAFERYCMSLSVPNYFTDIYCDDRYDKAEKAIRRALAIYEKINPEGGEWLTGRLWLAEILVKKDIVDPDPQPKYDIHPLLDEYEESIRKFFGKESEEYAEALMRSSVCLFYSFWHEDGITKAKEAYKYLSPEFSNYGELLREYANTCDDDSDEIIEVYKKYIEWTLNNSEAMVAFPDSISIAHSDLAKVYLKRGDFVSATEEKKLAKDIVIKLYGPGSADALQEIESYARHLAYVGQTSSAVAEMKKAIEIRLREKQFYAVGNDLFCLIPWLSALVSQEETFDYFKSIYSVIEKNSDEESYGEFLADILSSGENIPFGLHDKIDDLVNLINNNKFDEELVDDNAKLFLDALSHFAKGDYHDSSAEFISVLRKYDKASIYIDRERLIARIIQSLYKVGSYAEVIKFYKKSTRHLESSAGDLDNQSRIRASLIGCGKNFLDTKNFVKTLASASHEDLDFHQTDVMYHGLPDQERISIIYMIYDSLVAEGDYEGAKEVVEIFDWTYRNLKFHFKPDSPEADKLRKTYQEILKLGRA